MYRIPIFIIALFVISALIPQKQQGVERWDVKTLTDTAAHRIDFNPRPATILQLRSLTKPPHIANDMPRTGVEFLTFKVKCNISRYLKEDDGDLHLVLTDLYDSTLTMIGEIPLKYFDSVRTQFNKHSLPNGKYPKGKYELVGVAFFDKLHGQTGHAPNAIELHPIISFKKLD